MLEIVPPPFQSIQPFEAEMQENAEGRVVGVFSTPQALQDVIDGLELAGFDREQFGTLTPKEFATDSRPSSEIAKDRRERSDAAPDPENASAVDAGIFGAAILIGVLTVAGGPILAGAALGATLASVLTGAGAGALVGGLVAHGLSQHHAEYVSDQVRRGGLVLWVLTRSAHQEDQAVEAMRQAGATESAVQVSLK